MCWQLLVGFKMEFPCHPTVARWGPILAVRINQKQGFAPYRYGEVWAHTANPNDPLAGARHGNEMRLYDPLLPQLPSTPLLGMFRRTHMVTLLQMAKAGNVTYPDSPDIVDYNAGNAAWKNALDKGVRVRVFQFGDVMKHQY